MKQTISVWGCLGLIVLAPLFKAGAPDWAGLLWTTLALLGFGIHLLLKPSFRFSKFVQSPLVYLALFLLWQAIQYLAGISQNKNAAILILLETAGYLAFGAILIDNVSSIKHRYQVFNVIVGLSVFEALYGWWQLFSPSPTILWMPKIHYLDKLTGTFVNANHTAAFLLIALILVGSYWYTGLKSALTGKKSTIAALRHLNSSHSFVIPLLVVSLVATRSLGALLAASAVVTVSALFLWRRNAKLLVSSMLIASALVIVAGAGLTPQIFLEEIRSLSPTLERRIQIWDNAAEALQHCWALGCGGGSFYSEYPQYRNLAVGHGRYDHAHNDYIEFIFEFGVVGCCLLFGFVVSALRLALTNLEHANDRIDIAFIHTAVLVSIGLAIHSIVDFPLHIHAYALLYICVLLTAAHSGSPRAHYRTASPKT